jgi:hypothetical protein
MNPEISKNKYEKFVQRHQVKEIMDLLTNALSAMYENDQYHKDKDPLDTLRGHFGAGSGKKKSAGNDEADNNQSESLQ